MRLSKINLTFLMILGSLSNVWAVGLQVSPARTTLLVKPGEAKEGSYFIKNNTDQTQKVLVEAEDWGLIKKGQRGVATKDWLTFEKSEFVLEPGESYALKYRVQLSEEFKGERTAQVFFVPQVIDNSLASAVSLSIRSGVLLMVIAQGTEVVEAELKDIAVAKKIDGDYLKIGVQNNGNIHVKVRGRATLQTKKEEVPWVSPLAPPLGLLAHESSYYGIKLEKEIMKDGEQYVCKLDFEYGVDQPQGLKMMKVVNLEYRDGEVKVINE